MTVPGHQGCALNQPKPKPTAAMISYQESSEKWYRTIEYASSIATLRDAVKGPPNESICALGLRSLCWKTFLLFRDTDQEKWSSNIRDSRAAYSSLRGHFLKYVEQPELLHAAADPLNDDANSPWNTLRKDEELRVEIIQDVERCMPDEPYFRLETTQKLLTDILFVYCKINADIGYRQGMHEILAPVLWVIEKDALGEVSISPDVGTSDLLMIEVLSSKYIEHDSFTLFSLIMRTAKSFYELGEPEKSPGTGSPAPPSSSPIVERSKRIHETMLARLDPELAAHLLQIEILPQIFLIRWIRVLFGREFPFESLLSLWDLLFAEDPDLELIDFVCVAMLLRIRWQLLDADYSVALMLLLKYPVPEQAHGPQTFVEDAIFLRNNMSASAASQLIHKYSGRTPDVSSTSSRPATPRVSSQLNMLEQTLSRRRSPLPSPASFLKQQGGVEAILQRAAKGVLDRGERLGINEAVRDAVGEVRKNMQGLSPTPSLSRKTSENQGWKIDDRRQAPAVAKALVALEARNRMLGELLSDVTDALYRMSTSTENKDDIHEPMSIAIRRLGLIKDCLNDSRLPLPALAPLTNSKKHFGDVSRTGSVANASEEDNADVLKDPASFDLEDYDVEAEKIRDSQRTENKMQVNVTPEINISSVGQGDGPSSPTRKEPEVEPEAPPQKLARPPAIIPTRSTLAQSSFAFMLEPGEEPHSASKTSSLSSSTTFGSSGKKSVPRHARERSSFLFGDDSEEVSAGASKKDPLTGEGFSLEEMKK